MASTKEKDDAFISLLNEKVPGFKKSGVVLKVSDIQLQASLVHGHGEESYVGSSLLYTDEKVVVLRVPTDDGKLTLWYGILYDFVNGLKAGDKFAEDGIRCAFLGPGIRHDQSLEGSCKIIWVDGNIKEISFNATGSRDRSTMKMVAPVLRSK